jgi:hypothetical protein
MVRGAVIQQPLVSLVGIDLPRIGLVVRGALGQNLSKYPFAPSLTVSLTHPHG